MLCCELVEVSYVGGEGGGGGIIGRVYWLRGGWGGGLSLCSTSPPQGEVGGKLGPSGIDVSSIATTATVS